MLGAKRAELERQAYRYAESLLPKDHPDPDSFIGSTVRDFMKGAKRAERVGRKANPDEETVEFIDSKIGEFGTVNLADPTPDGGFILFIRESYKILFEPGDRDTDNEEEAMMLSKASDDAHKNRQELSQLLSDISKPLFERFGFILRDNRFDPGERGLVIFLRNGQERSYEVNFPEEIPRKMLSAVADLMDGYRVKVVFASSFGKPKLQEAMGVITQTLRTLGYKKAEAEEMYNKVKVDVRNND